ncbi:enamine deaminase RidA (YjgF/YER057c/UK114 family) [Actinomadura pelletieri DSM 43383]|uniref:Enamine deaminase RidA (YjgF/YER057c/UK114 family) n=1 Tax=Actinomadura pelletieri DSM 43383 TaxID=1120940 RepID=A0A495QQ23_9ACTN|nr:RidA family protein [Actinomadura pelletieri]RKS75065.1 enamine deaminase RidA (YjgF/YER057c/UK114 family) [Actinomadura pelletieri DSM 43383]
MRVTFGNPETVPPPPRPVYSHTALVTAGPLLFVSGQVALDENGNIDAPGDMARQTEVTFGYIEKILAAHGAGFADVVKVQTFLTDMDLLPEYAEARKPFMKDSRPVSTAVEVSRLFHPDALLEVELVAVPGN